MCCFLKMRTIINKIFYLIYCTQFASLQPLINRVQCKRHQHCNISSTRHPVHPVQLFLAKKGRFFLISCLKDTAVDLKILSERLGFKKSDPLRLAPYDVMTSVLRVDPGSVTPFAMMFATCPTQLLLDVRFKACLPPPSACPMLLPCSDQAHGASVRDRWLRQVHMTKAAEQLTLS